MVISTVNLRISQKSRAKTDFHCLTHKDRQSSGKDKEMDNAYT